MKSLNLVAMALFVIGLIIVVRGTIFTLRGKSIISTPSSFMHSFSAWTANNYIVIAIGIAVIVAGLVLMQYSKKDG
jgi:hypothetical protein